MIDLFDFVVGEVAVLVGAFLTAAELVAVGLEVWAAAVAFVVVVYAGFALMEV